MLRITEIFLSIQGESSFVGFPTVFVRLTGCPLRCQYCDTAYAFHGGTKHEIDEIVAQVLSYHVQHVTVTGGEPLSQPAVHTLMTKLCDRDKTVSLETSGALDISSVDPRVIKIMDIKTPGSGEESKNRYQNLQYLALHDEIKFVICDEDDYMWAKALISQRQLHDKCQILFSNSHQALSPSLLADWIVRDRLSVRFQTQLHKLLWGDEPGR